MRATVQTRVGLTRSTFCALIIHSIASHSLTHSHAASFPQLGTGGLIGGGRVDVSGVSEIMDVSGVSGVLDAVDLLGVFCASAFAYCIIVNTISVIIFICIDAGTHDFVAANIFSNAFLCLATSSPSETRFDSPNETQKDLLNTKRNGKVVTQNIDKSKSCFKIRDKVNLLFRGVSIIF